MRSTTAPAALAAALLTALISTLLTGCSGKGDKVSYDTPAARSQSASRKQPTEAERRAQELTQLPTGPQAQWAKETDVDGGTTISVTTLVGRKSGFTGQVWVWVPRQYFEPKYSMSGFPVMIALPGGKGFPKTYWTQPGLGLQTGIHKWSQEGTSQPFIVVMPVLNPSKEYYQDGSDIPEQAKMGTWLSEDVPQLVKENFRTFKSRDGWGWMGSSSGGFAALKFVLQKPEQFKAVIASGPDTRPDSPLWKHYEKEKQANNPEKLAAALIEKGGPDVYVAFQVGTLEPAIMPNIKNFIKNYGHGPIKTNLQVIKDGQHDAKSYIRGMGEGTMQWYSQWFQAPIATP
ncbi:alpha/beta hydrolase [Streptomyces antimicrobicus]|uniref:Esterase family protein n=1 Tax=Streptomyces antimicrobicus TaxID=2883108 RepID=A0ABS8B2S8_9ACTN|nr:alpha/beta hydrolase-fold protein [Streptomyces antimicrobicus]MCB5178916.1 esterase family protein [Streptomyces antimicrobicus]